MTEREKEIHTLGQRVGVREWERERERERDTQCV